MCERGREDHSVVCVREDRSVVCERGEGHTRSRVCVRGGERITASCV